MAPELLLDEDRHASIRQTFAGTRDVELLNAPSSKVDIFSFAMVIYEILARKLPFFNIPRDGAVENAILRGDRPMLPSAAEALCPPLNRLMEQCWVKEPSNRPDFAALVPQIASLLEGAGGDPRTQTETKIADVRLAMRQVSVVRQRRQSSVTAPLSPMSLSTVVEAPPSQDLLELQQRLHERELDIQRREQALEHRVESTSTTSTNGATTNTSNGSSSFVNDFAKFFGGGSSDPLTDRLLAENDVDLPSDKPVLHTLDSMFLAATRGSVA